MKLRKIPYDFLLLVFSGLLFVMFRIFFNPKFFYVFVLAGAIFMIFAVFLTVKYLRKILGVVFLISIMILGVFSNWLVITLNKGMPIGVEVEEGFGTHSFYVTQSDSVILPFLGDIFIFKNRVYSIGDILILAGLLLAVFYILYVHYFKEDAYENINIK